MTSLADLQLRERTPRHCRLAPDEVRHLLMFHRDHLEIVPTSKRHGWKVTPRGVAGVILTPRRRLILEPKIPMRHVVDLLPDSDAQARIAPQNGIALLDLLTLQLACLMEERAKVGLHRAYNEYAHTGSYLVGALDIPAQMRQPGAHKDVLHSRAEERTAALLCNQVPRAVAERLAHCPGLQDATRARLHQAVASFDAADRLIFRPEHLTAVLREPIPVGYRPLLELCHLLSGVVESTAGHPHSASWLISMERWFERMVTRTVEEAIPGGARSQATFFVGEPPVAIRPDVTIEQQGQVRVLIDAKWKQAPRTEPDRDDLNQILAYAGMLGARSAVLVYPGRGPSPSWTFPTLALTLHVHKLDVSGPIDRCRRSRERLGRLIRRIGSTK